LKKKTHKLSVKTEHDSVLIGISSHENDYRLSWAINKHLGTNLIKAENLIVYHEKFDVDQEFSLFVFEDEDSMLKYQLIANKCDNGYLIPELSNIDFFLQIHGEIDNNYTGMLLEKLKRIYLITAAFVIDPSSLKSKKRLIHE
jgi:hypothetical protein